MGEQFVAVGEEPRALLVAVLDQLLVPDDVDRLAGRRAAQRVASEGETVHEGVALLEGRVDPARHRHRAEGHVTTRDALGHRHDVGIDAEVIHREPLARAAESGDDLVGDDQHLVAVADLPDRAPVAVRRYAGVVRAAAVRRGQEGRDRLGAGVVNRGLQRPGALDAPLLAAHPLGPVEVRVLPDARPLRQHRLEARLRGGVMRDAQGRERHAVVRVAVTDDLVLRRVAEGYLRLAGQLDRGLDRFGPT